MQAVNINAAAKIDNKAVRFVEYGITDLTDESNLRSWLGECEEDGDGRISRKTGNVA
jgi:hypothetical protein